MRILFATDNFYPNMNGAARFAYELAHGLLKQGHQISVIAPSTKFEDTINILDGMTVYGIRSVMIPNIIHPGGIRLALPISPELIKEIIQKTAPDIIHIQDHFMIGASAIDAAKDLAIPTIGTNHFMPENFLHYLYPPDFVKKPLSKLAWRHFITIYKRLDLITAPTKTAAHLINSLGLKNHVIPVSCGVDLKKFNPKNDGNYLRNRYKINAGKPVVLFLGRLDKEKNIDLVIKAFARVLKSIDATLVIAGQGKEEENLIKLTQELDLDDSVVFTGFVPEEDLPFLYSLADLYVIASIAELQSISTMEAMASGLPVVAVRIMALPELVHDGENGYLFSIRKHSNGLFHQTDTRILANQIIKILVDPKEKKRMSENSLKIIQAHKLENTIKSYEEIYQKLLASKTSL